MKKVNIMVGKFQPFTVGHYECIKASKYPTVICWVTSKQLDDKHPFNTNKLIKLYSGLIDGNKIIDIIAIDRNWIGDIANHKKFKDNEYEIATWTCGKGDSNDKEDRPGSYEAMAKRYINGEGKDEGKAKLANDFKVIPVSRSMSDADKNDDGNSKFSPYNVSATKVRTCLRKCIDLEENNKANSNEYKEQKARLAKMIPNKVYSEKFYKELRDMIKKVPLSTVTDNYKYKKYELHKRIERLENLLLENRVRNLEKLLNIK